MTRLLPVHMKVASALQWLAFLIGNNEVLNSGSYAADSLTVRPVALRSKEYRRRRVAARVYENRQEHQLALFKAISSVKALCRTSKCVCQRSCLCFDPGVGAHTYANIPRTANPFRQPVLPRLHPRRVVLVRDLGRVARAPEEVLFADMSQVFITAASS